MCECKGMGVQWVSGECSEQRREVSICLPREVWRKFFRGHFSVAWMGCRSTFMLCTALPLLSGFRDRLHDSRNALLLSTSIPFQLSVQKNVYLRSYLAPTYV